MPKGWGRRLRTRRASLPVAGVPSYYLVKDFILELPGRISDSQDISGWFGVTDADRWWFGINALLFVVIVAFSLCPVAWLPAPLRRQLVPASATEEEQEEELPTEEDVQMFMGLNLWARAATGCKKKFHLNGNIPGRRFPSEQVGAALGMFYNGMSYKQIAENMEDMFDIPEPSKATI